MNELARFLDDPGLRFNRRHFFSRTSLGLGGAALASLLCEPGAPSALGADTTPTRPKPIAGMIDPASGGILKAFHVAPKAKRIIYLFMSGGPSQLDLFDYKPLLNELNGRDLPDSVRMGQRLTGMSANQATLPIAGSIFKFGRHGQSGTWVSELLPHTAGVVDELCLITSLYTEAINHDPAITFFQTGSSIAGRPAMGSWLSYGLGSANQNLPTFCVLISQKRPDQPLYSRLWGNGFLPSVHQGVQFRAGADPVLYLDNPPGVSAPGRRKMLDRLRELHQIEYDATLDPSIQARIAQYEMAYRMQTSVPEVTRIADEPDHIFDLYGPDSRKPGPCAALIQDLKQRGMLDDTLVLWGGEFGRTNYSQGKLTASDYGRDHHPRCFTVWAAGGGIKPGITYGATDPFGYSVATDGVHVNDFHATILYLLGIDHERLTYKHQGRYYRLTDVAGKVVKGMIS